MTRGRIAGLVWLWLAFVVATFALFSLGGGIFVWVLAFTPLACVELAVGVRLLWRPIGARSAATSLVLGLISSVVGAWALVNSSEMVVAFWATIFLASSIAVASYGGTYLRALRRA